MEDQIFNMKNFKCEHGSDGNHQFPGSWNGGVSQCSCCGGLILYIDSFSGNFEGDYKSVSWQPKDKCGICGGGYIVQESTKTYNVIFKNFAEQSEVRCIAYDIKEPKYSCDIIKIDPQDTLEGPIKETIFVNGKITWEPISLKFKIKDNDEIMSMAQRQIQKQFKCIDEKINNDYYYFSISLEEKWNIEGAWIQAANFNDLDSDDESSVSVELIIFYGNATPYKKTEI